MSINTTETRIDGKLYCVIAECSSTATETVEKKLTRLICRHATDTENYHSVGDISLAMCEIVREHDATSIIKE